MRRVVRNIMALKNYKRAANLKTYIHRIIIIICIISLIYSLFKLKYDYTVLILIFYFVIDVILNPKTISITDTYLVISKQFFAGLINQKDTISLDKILKISSVGLDVSNDSNPDSGSGILWPGNGETPFDLYQVDYLGENQERKKLTLNLYINEYNMLQEILRTTSVGVAQLR